MVTLSAVWSSVGGSQHHFNIYAHRVVTGAKRTLIKPTSVPIIWQRCDLLEEERFSCDTMGHWLNPTRGAKRFVGVVRPAFAMAITQQHGEQENGLVVGPHSQAPHNDLCIFVS